MTGALSLMSGVGNSSSLSVTANDVTRADSGFTASGNVTSIQLPNTNVTGGVSPYSYAWTRQSGSTVPVVSSSTADNPTWSGTVSEVEEAVWRVTVTDAAAATAYADITVLLRWTDFS